MRAILARSRSMSSAEFAACIKGRHRQVRRSVKKVEARWKKVIAGAKVP
jgi:phage regulator Rha-like protein